MNLLIKIGLSFAPRLATIEGPPTEKTFGGDIGSPRVPEALRALRSLSDSMRAAALPGRQFEAGEYLLAGVLDVGCHSLFVELRRDGAKLAAATLVGESFGKYDWISIPQKYQSVAAYFLAAATKKQ